MKAFLYAMVCSAFLSGLATAGETIRIEGENPTTDSMNRHPWWYDKVKTGELSGGAWISNFHKDKPGEATYTFSVKAAGDYHFWLRANPTAVSLSYKLDGGEWKPVPVDRAIDRRNIAADDKVDLRFIAWIQVAKVKLTRGKHTIAFRMDSKNSNHGAIDVMVFSTDPISPEGTGQGNAKVSTPTEEDAWAFLPPSDEFKADALLDLRGLNEKTAGEHGFIRLSEDGQSFLRGDGQPIRFWSAHAGPGRLSPEDMDAQARFLAKMGVNLVRVGANIAPLAEGQKIDDVNQQAVERLWRYVKALKDAGIYVMVCPYWYHHAMPGSWADALPGWKKGDKPTGSLFFSPAYQDAYKKWVTALYKPVNPHTGIPLANDPAVAIIQLINEDSLLFFTSQAIPREQVEILAGQYADWLKTKYGSLDKALAAWSGEKIAEGAGNAMGKMGDDLAKGQVGMYIIWEMTQKRTGGKDKRLTDQMEFMTWRQKKFYDDMRDFYRKDLGCKQLTNAMDWRSADKLTTDDAERYSYTGCDVIAVNRYTGGKHVGQNNGYRIDPGHEFANRSVLRNPLQMPTNLKQPVGRPFLITESAWVKPNLYQSEGGLMTAAYCSLTGVDSLCWFSTSLRDWLRDPRRMFWSVKAGSDGGYAIDKWGFATPPQMGMMPANAILFREGYLKQGSVVVREERPLEDLWARKSPIIAETEAFDPNRDTKDLRDQSGKTATDVSRLAFLVGPVEVQFGGDASRTTVADISKYVDGRTGVVRSNTGEIALNYKKGLLTVDAPKVQAVAGFLKDAGGSFKLADVTIESSNDYATIEVVAMDGQPLKTSKKVLVQVGTTARLTGWTERDVEVDGEPGKEIVLTGKPPYQVKNTHATVTIGNAGLTKATLLDPAGYKVKDVPVKRAGGKLTVTLPENTMYLVLQ